MNRLNMLIGVAATLTLSASLYAGGTCDACPCSAKEASTGANEQTPAAATAAAVAPMSAEETSSAAGIDGKTWLNTIEEAVVHAKKLDRPIYLTVSGSNWCPPCIQMKKAVYATKEFQDWAKDHAVLVDIDLPRRTPISPQQRVYNEVIASHFGVERYPTVLVLDRQGKKVNELNAFDVLTGEVPLTAWLDQALTPTPN
jgi:thiol-disulfide isomerase/thioredoxin